MLVPTDNSVSVKEYNEISRCKDLEIEIEKLNLFLIAAPNNTPIINYIKTKIDNTQKNNKHGLYGDRNEN